MYAGRLELHLILQKSAWDRPRVPNFRSHRVIIFPGIRYDIVDHNLTSDY